MRCYDDGQMLHATVETVLSYSISLHSNMSSSLDFFIGSVVEEQGQEEDPSLEDLSHQN